MLFDHSRLKDILSSVIDQDFDHKNLNLDVPEFKDKLATSENVAIQIWKWMEPYLTDCKLHCVKLVETESIYVEYFGE